MVSKALVISTLLFISYFILPSTSNIHNHTQNPFSLTSNGSSFAGIRMPTHNFDVGCTLSSSPIGKSDVGKGQNLEKMVEGHVVKVPLRRRSNGHKGKHSIVEYTVRDMNRIHTFRRKIIEKNNQQSPSRVQNHGQNRHLLEENLANSRLVGSLKSGVSHGSGEYFMDVFVGTPPKHFSLILDTGSDLNWIQCVPCFDCFEQDGPHYDPRTSNSFQNMTCNDPRCHLVTSPEPSVPCEEKNQSCPYFYWYGDSSNTTGDFALETFTVNLTAPNRSSEFKKVENIMFGCGHWNRGLFHGAAGLLGLGRGPLSFSSQIQSSYGHSFSYCLVDRDSDPSVSSKLIFGEDKDLLAHPSLNFTTLVNGKDSAVDTFYYIDIKSIFIGGETLTIPKETWDFNEDGGGGTIIDSGTTLSYFCEPAYELIKNEFIKRIKNYPLVLDFPILKPCYNVSKIEKLDFPSFKIQFKDGAEWDFPIENYFIRVDQELVCLAMLGTKKTAFSIIGNYQQQNFHVLYDTNKSRLGFAPTSCADV